MKLGKFSSVIATLFTDKMTINRYTNSQNEDGTTDTVLSETPIYSDIPCRISFAQMESPKDKEIDDTPVSTTPKIFCKVGIDIREGDFVTVYRLDDNGTVIATYSGKVGMPSTLITHKEALFYIDRSA